MQFNGQNPISTSHNPAIIGTNTQPNGGFRGGISPTLDKSSDPQNSQPFAGHDKDKIEIKSNPQGNEANASGKTEATSANPHLDGPAGKLIRLTESLTDVIKEENRLLEARRVSEIKSVQQEKNRLSAEYQKEMQRIRINDNILGPKDSPVRETIKEVTKSFHDELIKHGKLLMRFKNATEGMIKAISKEVSKQKPVAQQYNARANMQPSLMARPQSIALNQVV